MRVACAIVLAVVTARPAVACPRRQDVDAAERPTTASCLGFDWNQLRSVLELRYTLGVGGTMRTGIGGAASGHLGLDVVYAVQFGSDPEQPRYEIEVSGGAIGQRFAGAIAASALATRAGLRFGPARVPAHVDDDRSNVVSFPMTLELAHNGELGARPRISARPELARGLYTRERIELATRAVRVEGAGYTRHDRARVEDKPPTAWALDFLPLHTGVDIAVQDATRVDTRIGGGLLGLYEHTRGTTFELIGIEHRHVDAPMAPPGFLTIWVVRVDVADPETGTTYTLGLGKLLLPPELDDFAYRFDDDGAPAIGAAGWFFRRDWGGVGLQYRRDSYVAITGELGIEDRVSGEVAVPALLDGVVRGFAARTSHLVEDELVHEVTAGVEIAASYAHAGLRARLALELGRTFYTALDDALPTTTGFAAALGLTVDYANSHTW